MLILYAMIIAPEKSAYPGDVISVDQIGDDQMNDNQRQNAAVRIIFAERAIDADTLEPEDLKKQQKELKEKYAKHLASIEETDRRLRSMSAFPAQTATATAK